jgi:SAM-dependent methyltransferase
MRMIDLEACPGCAGERFREVYAYNDLVDWPGPEARAIETSAFCACDGCGLFFARRRQDLDSAAEFYAAFARLEHRHYATYPLPAAYVRGKEKRAAQICGFLDQHHLLRPDLDVLHLRCDGGTLLAHLRAEWGVSGLFGLDYFDSNLRHAAEVLRLEHIAPLDAGRGLIPFERRFDLIIANHMLTHALDPRRLLATIRERLKPDGAVYFYNEVDHEALMAPGSELLAGGINAFHKQLFTRLSLAHLLRGAGFGFEAIQGQGSWLAVLARPGGEGPPAALPDPEEIARLEAMFAGWAAAHERRRVARRRRRALVAWVGPQRYQRAAATYRTLRGLARLGTRRPPDP